MQNLVHFSFFSSFSTTSASLSPGNMFESLQCLAIKFVLLICACALVLSVRVKGKNELFSYRSSRVLEQGEARFQLVQALRLAAVVEGQRLAEQQLQAASTEATADGESVRALPAGLADRDCGSQRLEGGLELADSHEVERGSSADTVACDVHRDTAGILVGTAACGRKERRELSVDLADSQGKSRAVANEIRGLPFPDDVKQSRSVEEWTLPGCVESGQQRLQLVESAWQLVEPNASRLDAEVDPQEQLKLQLAYAQPLMMEFPASAAQH
jgi:hypothetical protein